MLNHLRAHVRMSAKFIAVVRRDGASISGAMTNGGFREAHRAQIDQVPPFELRVQISQNRRFARPI
jgi:hypothetical protein